MLLDVVCKCLNSQTNGVATQPRVPEALQQPVATLQAEVSSFGVGCRRRHRAVVVNSLRGLAPALHASCGCAQCRLWKQLVGGLSPDHTEGPLMCCCT